MKSNIDRIARPQMLESVYGSKEKLDDYSLDRPRPATAGRRRAVR